MKRLSQKIGMAPATGGLGTFPERLGSLNDEKLMLLRDMMVHLVTLIDLDVGSRGGKEHKGG